MTEKEIATVESLRKDGILSLKDAQGNPRFVEGDITMKTIEGVTQTYGKWSLSGTHLMIVVTLSIENGTTIPARQNICSIVLPQWIMDKIIPLFSTYVSINSFRTMGANADASLLVFLHKYENYLRMDNGSSPYVSSRNESVRIQFDLLIDAD